MAKKTKQSTNDKVIEVQMDTGDARLKKNPERALLNVVGGVGTDMSGGYIYEEYNPKLQGLAGIKIFDKMRKGDAKVFATLLACELPIRSTKWTIEPFVEEGGIASSQDVLVADLVRRNLFETMTMTWDQMLTEILTMLPFGFSVFEKVYRVIGSEVMLKELAPRKQTTIEKWEMDDGEPGIKQFLPDELKTGENKGQTTANIPAEKLVLFTWRKEGNNYEGVSLLRSAYKHWHFKDTFYKFDAVRQERQAVGIPVVYIPSGADDADKEEAKRIVENIRSTEHSGIVMPGPKEDGWLFEFAHVNGNDGTQIYESIKHHNQEIANNILAQFMNLGQTDSGSRSLGESQTEFFLMAMESVTKHIEDVFNKYVIPEIVDLNFSVENYPKLCAAPLGKEGIEKVSKSLKELTESKVVIPDERLENYVRDLYGFPQKDEETERVVENKEENNAKEPKEKKTPQNDKKKEIGKKEGDKMKKEAIKANTWFDPDFMSFSEIVDNKFISDLQNELTHADKQELKKKGLRFNDFEKEAGRPLTFAERKVNFSSIQRSMEVYEEKIDREAGAIFEKQKEKLLKDLKRAIDKNDTKGISTLKVSYKNEMAKTLTETQKEMFEVGKKTAATEMDVRVPPTKSEVKGAMRVQNDSLVKEVSGKMESAVSVGAAEMVAKKGGISNVSSAEVLGVVSSSLDNIATKAKNAFRTLGVTGAVNLGRTSIFERYPEKIYAMQYSAILDDRTTDHCLSLDGRIVKPGSSEYYDYSPPQHFNALVEGSMITTKEGEKKIEDIKIGDEVLTHKNRYCKVYDVMDKFEYKDYFELELEDGKILKITGEHPVFTERGWVRVDELKEDDLVFCA